MNRYEASTKDEVRRLRSIGKTYTEINQLLELQLSKSTLSVWCRNVKLPLSYPQKVISLNKMNLNKARKLAHKANVIKRESYLRHIHSINTPIAEGIENINTAKIALAMLCLGEASKSGSGTSFYFGNSDPRIILLFIELLKRCFDFDINKARCTVQCRADQDTIYLEDYWAKLTNIPKNLFYKSRIDQRTVGKPTKKTDYKGVLRIDYFDSKVRHELESLANLVYNRLITEGPVV